MILHSKGCKLFLMCVSACIRGGGKGGRGVALAKSLLEQCRTPACTEQGKGDPQQPSENNIKANLRGRRKYPKGEDCSLQ